jgi:hypothetical protein
MINSTMARSTIIDDGLDLTRVRNERSPQPLIPAHAAARSIRVQLLLKTVIRRMMLRKKTMMSMRLMASPLHPLAYPLTHPLAHPLAHPLVHPLMHPLAHPLTHPLTHHLTHRLMHCLTRPLMHPLTEGTKSDCGMRNQSLDVRSITLLVRQYVGSRCT